MTPLLVEVRGFNADCGLGPPYFPANPPLESCPVGLPSVARGLPSAVRPFGTSPHQSERARSESCRKARKALAHKPMLEVTNRALAPECEEDGGQVFRESSGRHNLSVFFPSVSVHSAGQAQSLKWWNLEHRLCARKLCSTTCAHGRYKVWRVG